MSKHRILIVDDNPAIHQDFRKILCPAALHSDALADAEAALFGAPARDDSAPHYDLEFASQGKEALRLVQQAQTAQLPYSMAFIDVRMPPGWDGIETTARIWECDPDMQVVICTAYSDYSWKQILGKLGHSDRLVILKKPFDNIEVLQLADGLTNKRAFVERTKRRVVHLETLLKQRTHELDESSVNLRAAQERLLKLSDYDATLATQKGNRLVSQAKLRQALERNELTVHYQPLFDVASRRIVGLEALARWTDAEQGTISPAEFIPLAEETGLIAPLGEFVLHTACAQVFAWQRDNVPVVPVAVNISPLQLQHNSLLQQVRSALRNTGLASNLLALELTESTLIKDNQLHVNDLKSLRADGVQIEIDDFGTGYSSLSYLRRLPIDTLKVDRSFIKDVDTNPADESIVNAILSMAHTLGLKVVAEGIETESQLATLRRHGCEFAQGFYFCKPLPADACRTLLLDLAQRPSFTDTLRLQLTSPGLPRLASHKHIG